MNDNRWYTGGLLLVSILCVLFLGCGEGGDNDSHQTVVNFKNLQVKSNATSPSDFTIDWSIFIDINDTNISKTYSLSLSADVGDSKGSQRNVVQLFNVNCNGNQDQCTTIGSAICKQSMDAFFRKSIITCKIGTQEYSTMPILAGDKIDFINGDACVTYKDPTNKICDHTSITAFGISLLGN